MNECQDRAASCAWLSAAVHAEAMRSLPTVDQVMGKDMLAVTDDMPKDAALRVLVQHHLLSVPVVRGSTPVGVVSVCDLADTGAASCDGDGYPLYYRYEDDVPRSWLERRLAARPGQVRDVMHPFVLSIEASANLVQAAHRMLSENVRRLLVRDGTELVGVVTSADLLGGLARWFSPEVTLTAHVVAGMGPGGHERPAAPGPENQ
jgi:CBS domain-containing protein